MDLIIFPVNFGVVNCSGTRDLQTPFLLLYSLRCLLHPPVPFNHSTHLPAPSFELAFLYSLLPISSFPYFAYFFLISQIIMEILSNCSKRKKRVFSKSILSVHILLCCSLQHSPYVHNYIQSLTPLVPQFFRTRISSVLFTTLSESDCINDERVPTSHSGKIMYLLYLFILHKTSCLGVTV